jgi:hypothetical protein
VGFSSSDTERFNLELQDLIGSQFAIFKVMSPKDVYYETVDAQRYFHGSFSRMIGLIQQRMLSVYLNALAWKEGVLDLIDRMDHYIVYVSSITDSAMWELEQLDTDDRRARVTVVFDESAIEDKVSQLYMRDQMQELVGERMIWSKQGGPPKITAEELRASLSAKFLVTTPDAFQADIDHHRKRIVTSSGKFRPGERETWLDFRFYPGLPEDELSALRAVSDASQARIDAACADGIDCLPLFLMDIQLRIYVSLLFGEHAEVGRALAAYQAVMQGALGYYEPAGERVGALSAENRERLLSVLRDHQEYAAYTGVRLLGYGRSHEFEDRSEAAAAETKAVCERTRAAVNRFFEERGGPLPS